ncbi:MAG: XRE family transcriptional regulator [Erysipelotrichia bacterium]|nr:XRE family transcriptional regulator [Erysipelotrichia bacterium]NCC55010.1 XRE family transcriptional regulator [Erysipelotrichia bacterium]
MKTIGQRIREKRESLQMSQEELALKLGYKSRSSINKIEIDGRSVPQNKLKEIAEVLHTTPAYIMGWDEEVKVTPHFHEHSFLKIPLYEGLSCGMGGYVDEMANDYISIPASMLRPNKQYFANYASGDSMINQNINDGDLIIFEKCNEIQNGQVGSFIIEDEQATCKIFKRDSKTGLIMLLPANNAYDPIPINPANDTFRVIGKLALVINNRQDS